MRITIDPVKYKSYLSDKFAKSVAEEKRKTMEARAEILLKDAFKGDNMNGTEARTPTTEAPQKAFESIILGLTKCKKIASHLSTKSEKLVSSFTGMNELLKDTEKKQKVDSVVLIHVLRDIEEELCRSLTRISGNLDKLEKAW